MIEDIIKTANALKILGIDNKIDAIGHNTQQQIFKAAGLRTINNILPDDRRNFTLTAGNNITLTENTNGLSIASGTDAPTNAQYVVMALNATLTDERVLAVGSGLSLTDGGAGGNATLTNTGVTSIVAGTGITVIGATGAVTVNSAHNLLSASHLDTTAASVVRGDLITGQTATPLWKRLAIGSATTYLKSDGTDAAWATISGSDITGDALTKTDDTNVTLTLGGTPTTALLRATSITVGWSGTLAAARLNSNVVQAITNDTNVTGSIAAQNLTLGWTGTLAAARLNSNVVQGITNDTNITGSIAAQNLTLGWTGTLAATRLNSSVVQSVVNDTNVTGSIAAQALTLGWTGTLSPARGGTGIANNAASTITISGNFATTLTVSGATALTLPTSGTVAVTSNKLSVFAATSSAELAGVISDETGSGALVFANTPTLTTAVLGSSTATTQTPADNSTKIATTAYVDAAVLGQNFKEAVQEATTANLVGTYNNGVSGVGATFTYTALGADVIDGVTLALNDRVLVKNQTSAFQNGIYLVTTAGAVGIAGVLTRSTDADQTTDWKTGDSLFVINGTTLGNTTWAYTGIDSPTMGTTSLTFVQTAGQGTVTAGNGITVTGLSVAIDTSVTVDKNTAQALTNKDLSGAGNTFPTFNQNTTGSAATLTTTRTLWGQNFNGSANVTGDITLGTASITMTGSIAATGNRVTKGWFTDLESTNMPTVGGTAILTSLTAPQFTTIELGHASDTTIARVSAGVVSVEGVNLITAASTDTLSNKTLTAPKFADLGFIADANGNELIILDTTASAVNEITIANGATGNPASIIASGETNIGILLAGKGTGKIRIGDGADTTKLLTVELVGATTGKTLTLTSSHTDNRTITLPDASVTLASLTGTETLTNKTLTSPILTTPALGTPASGVATNLTGLPLTTGVTGTLPVGNGGTGTATAFTAGSVVFAGASGVYTQDNSNFFFNNTNDQLFIGVNTDESVFGTTCKIFLKAVSSGDTNEDFLANIYKGSTHKTGFFVSAKDTEVAFGATAGAAGVAVDFVFKTLTSGQAAVENFRIQSTGNMKLAGTAVRGTTEGTNHLDIFDGAAPVGTLTAGISLYSTSGELRVMDSAGNSTLLS